MKTHWNSLMSTISFVFLVSALLGENSGTFTDIRDGQIYKWVKIGEQVWMGENLAYKPASGEYWVYEDNPKHVEKYGYLYSWGAALKACPAGWHLPSDRQWQQLVRYVGYDQGKQLKSIEGWEVNLDHTDIYGFSALPGGFRDYDGSYTGIGRYGKWRTSTPTSPAGEWIWVIGTGRNALLRDGSMSFMGISVRCIKSN